MATYLWQGRYLIFSVSLIKNTAQYVYMRLEQLFLNVREIDLWLY